MSNQITITVSGSPGVGKTHLAEQIMEFLQGRGYASTEISSYCGDYGSPETPPSVVIREGEDPFLEDIGFTNGDFINLCVADVHKRNIDAGWWTDLQTGADLHGKRNVPEMLMLIVSEVSEAMEGYRKSLPDDKLPHRPMIEVELADTLIRIFDLAGGLDLDLGGAYVEKLAFNAQRQDHKPENRALDNGKKF